MKYGIAVGGAHGKTTTTSMIAAVLARGGLDPTIVVGGRLHAVGSNARLGHGQFLVAEADESDGSFLRLAPAVAVITNIDREHLDHYGDLDAIHQAFVYFANRVPFYGVAVLCADDAQVRKIVPRVTKRTLFYGTLPETEVRASDVRLKPHGARFLVHAFGREMGEVELQVPGRHNVLNALAAVAVALDLEVPFLTIQRALAGFAGVQRRFQVIGQAGNVTVVDDYGHHPVEIRATLAAAKAGFDRRVVVVFQPHRYTRTLHLYQEFLTSFNQADALVMMDIYPAGEPPIEGVSAADLAEAIRAHGHRDVTYLGRDRARVIDHVIDISRPGDLVITLGAGDVSQLGPELLRRLEAGT